MKLPLLLEFRKSDQTCCMPSVLFTVYRLSFSSRKKWGKRARANKRAKRKVEEIAGEVSGEVGDEIEPNRSCQLIQLGCGFFPLASNSSLLPNGNHDVKMKYVARNPRHEVIEQGHLSEDTLIISESMEASKWVFGQERIDTEDLAEDGESSVASSLPLPDTASATSASDSIAMSESNEDRRQRHSRQKSGTEPISIQVRTPQHQPSYYQTYLVRLKYYRSYLLSPPSLHAQVGVFVQSSVHAQNSTLYEFLSQESDLAVSAEATGTDISPLIGLSREEIYRQSSLCQPSEKSEYDTDKLLISTIDISKSSLCSVSDVSCHLLRIVSQLWKILISGVGEPDVAWANPATILPLRIQAFASLLQILGTSTIFLSKRGVTQLDGSHKWNLITLSRVMAVLFDEGTLYGRQAEEPFVKEFLGRPEKSASAETIMPKPRKDKRRRHVRSTFEFFSNGDGMVKGAEGSGNVFGDGDTESRMASTKKVTAGMDKGAPVDKIPSNKSVGDSKWGDVDDDVVFVNKSGESSQSETNTHGPKIDSVTDFRSALDMGTRENGDSDSTYESPRNSGEMVALAMINHFSTPSAGGKRWKTAPVSGLATINENEDGDRDNAEPDLSTLGVLQPKKPRGPLDALDYVESSKGSVKQMRVPKRTKDSGESRLPLKDEQTTDIGLKTSTLPTASTASEDADVDQSTLFR